MVGGIGNSSNVAELMGMMVQGQAQDPVASAASMDALKKTLDSSASEAAALVAQISAATTQGGLNVYA